MFYRVISIAFILGLCLVSFLEANPSFIPIDFKGKLDSKGVPEGWELKTKNGDALFKILNEDDEKIVHFTSIDSSFSFQRDISLNLKDYPCLVMKWKAVKLPTGGDVRKGKTDDQALQTLIAFKGGNILSYVWDTNAPEGFLKDDSIGFPLNLKIKILVVKSGASQIGQWLTITRNVYDDYKKFFGKEPPQIKGIRIQINSQNTGTAAESYFGSMIFKKDTAN
ncbi:MAG: DUF3047 domain-containing protein [Nitrospiraceae bacterium]|nr:DUF3047 domain-containing protein [Nitrospiraceae bacterium]